MVCVDPRAWCSEVGVIKQISSVRLFCQIVSIMNSIHILPIEYHIHIWQVSPQLSRGESHQIWLWLKESDRYSCKITHFACGEINERAMIAMFMGPIWGPSGVDRTQVGPMLAPWTLLSGEILVAPAPGPFYLGYGYFQQMDRDTVQWYMIYQH